MSPGMATLDRRFSPGLFLFPTRLALEAEPQCFKTPETPRPVCPMATSSGPAGMGPLPRV